MSTNQQLQKLNQYDLIIIAAEYMRKNPSTPETEQLKYCKNQSEVRVIIEKLYPMK